MKTLQQILWWCAGAQVSILDKYPTEWGKYFGIGGTILFTALMAGFAGGYAFYTAFQDVPLAFFFGAFWGALIFNLDRYIVSSIGKGDGTSKITWDEWKNAFPRIILAILIGFVIATPLELKVFEKEITVEIQEMINEKRQKMTAGLNDLRDEQQRLKDRIAELRGQEKSLAEDMKGHDPRIELSNQKISSFSAQERTLQQKLTKNQSRQSVLNTDILQLQNSSRSDSYSSLYKKQLQLNSLEKEAKNFKREIDQIRSGQQAESNTISTVQDGLKKNYGALLAQNNNAIQNLNDQIQEIDTLYQKKVKYYGDVSVQYNGFMARLEALNRLSYEVDTIYNRNYSVSTEKTGAADSTSLYNARMTAMQPGSSPIINKTCSVVWYAKWMLTILLIAIEITPILFKMMAESGPYDDRVEEIRYKSEVDKKKFISDVNQKVNTELRIAQEINDQKLNAELIANKELLKTISLAQAEIISVAIEKWKNGEIERARQSPDEFIKISAPDGTGT
ncbi:MAG: DUF4407 domain-containing protein [Saprospiraceae bacterium]|nr:DUF4407 domain-containing protein [Saprospiraceae bacterium]